MIGVIHLGLGAIGQATLHALLDRPNRVRILAAIDPHPTLAGRDLGDVLKRKLDRPMTILPTLADAKTLAAEAQVATMTTGSRIPDVRTTLEQLADLRLHVVSSCEELAFPQLRHPDAAAALDAYARQHGVAILGTGVNPGFAMDAFALTVTAACGKVHAIRCIRSLDARRRRYQLQKKVAAGMTVDHFRQELAAKRLGHVGLAESAALLAEGLGWTLERLDERFEPVIAAEPVASDHFHVAAGQVRGMRMIAEGFCAGRKVVELDLTMALGADTFDEIQIQSDPPVTARITTGFHGDASTVAILANSVQAIGRLQPGLRTMLDMLPLHSVAG